MCDVALDMILHILYISFFHIYVSMHLFYAIDALDIKKIEKKRIFLYVPIFSRFLPILSRFFRFFPIFSPRRFNPDRDFQNIGFSNFKEE